MNLAQLQTAFAEAIFANQRDSIATQVKAHGDLSALQRVGIYRNSVHGVLGDYLASLYPVCVQLVGEAFFTQICHQCIDRHPPSTPYLTDYGQFVAEILQVNSALDTMPWIADVARIEWARHQAWNAINQAPSDFNQLAQLNPEEQQTVCFALPQSAQLLQFNYAVDQVWLAHQEEAQHRGLSLEQIQIHQPTYLLIWRIKRSLKQVSLNAQQWQFLQAIQQKKTLTALAAQFSDTMPTLLSNAVQRGWIISFSSV